MKKIRIIMLLSFSLALSIPATAQKISEKLCNNIFDSVDSLMKPTKVYRRHLFTADCDFEFYVDDKTSVLLSIEQYENEKESRESFSENSFDFYGDSRKKTRVASFTSFKHWDEIGLFLSKRKHDSYLLIRKRQFLIQIFSDDRQSLLRIEKLLRNIDFEN